MEKKCTPTERAAMDPQAIERGIHNHLQTSHQTDSHLLEKSDKSNVFRSAQSTMEITRSNCIQSSEAAPYFKPFSSMMFMENGERAVTAQQAHTDSTETGLTWDKAIYPFPFYFHDRYSHRSEGLSAQERDGKGNYLHSKDQKDHVRSPIPSWHFPLTNPEISHLHSYITLSCIEQPEKSSTAHQVSEPLHSLAKGWAHGASSSNCVRDRNMGSGTAAMHFIDKMLDIKLENTKSEPSFGVLHVPNSAYSKTDTYVSRKQVEDFGMSVDAISNASPHPIVIGTSKEGTHSFTLNQSVTNKKNLLCNNGSSIQRKESVQPIETQDKQITQRTTKARSSAASQGYLILTDRKVSVAPGDIPKEQGVINVATIDPISIPMVEEMERNAISLSIRGTIRKQDRRPRQEFPCQFCNRVFPLKSNRKKHVESVHEKRRPHECHLCPKRFYEKCKLAAHIDTVHNNIRRFTCDICFAKFKQNSDCRRHMREVHEGQSRW